MKTNPNTLPESAEILRLALPLMSRFKIPVTPRNYAVWYEYAAGNNKYLSERIDGLIRSGAPINSGVISLLYVEFIDNGYELSQLERAQQIIAELQGSIGSVLDTAYGSTSEYGDSLDSFQKRIQADMNMEQLDFLIRDMASSTESMLSSNRKLMSELDSARQEAKVLRLQLQEARQQAKTDVLTELPNRKAFFDLLAEMDRGGEFKTARHSLFMLDIDNFKHVNDNYGHLLGDKVIKSVAQVLKKLTKGKDFPARIGGEEFIVLLPDTTIDGALSVAENIRRTIEHARIINPRNQQVISKVTVSIGITCFEPEDDLESVLHRADRALYLAKERGRNCIVDARDLVVPLNDMHGERLRHSG
jgi:diguanylate cyclase